MFDLLKLQQTLCVKKVKTKLAKLCVKKSFLTLLIVVATLTYCCNDVGKYLKLKYYSTKTNHSLTTFSN